MYEPAGEGDDLRQGDVIRNLVLPIGHNPDMPALFTAEGEAIENPEQPLVPGTVITLAAVRSAALIVSQTCDVVQNRPFITVARIHPLQEFDATYAGKNSARARAEHIARTYERPGAQPTRFYLQESGDVFPKSVASLLELTTLQNNPPTRDYLRRRRVLRLNAEATKDLQFRLSYFFGRFATAEHYMLTDEEKRLVGPR